MAKELPPDGSLSGEPVPEEPKEIDPERLQEINAMLAQAQAQAQQPPWRPACVSCMNGHKIAIAKLGSKLERGGMSPASPEFQQALQAAANAGAMLAQNPLAFAGLNGEKPDTIPPVRPSDLIINGSSCCAVCFQAQEQQSVLTAPGGWAPGR